MNSWIALFSQFTTEALLLEVLAILTLTCAYLAFWILKKRKYGILNETVPVGPVKSYLNDLIRNAEELRNQMFGLISETEKHRAGTAHSGATPAPQPIAPALTKGLAELSQLEQKLQQQAMALEALTSEKASLEKHLEEARKVATQVSQSQPKGEQTSKAQGTVTQLEEKILVLETKLAEYSVIEDDLANLKRLQQENARLKGLLEEKGTQPAAAGSSSRTPIAEKSKGPVESPVAAAEAAKDMILGGDDLILGGSEPAADPVVGGPADPVLGGESPTATTGPSSEPAASASAATETKKAPDSPIDQSEALLNEFEKMLKK